MSASAGNERWPGLADFARAWTRAVVGTCYVPMTRAEKTEFLYGLAERLAETLVDRTFEPARAYQVGRDMVVADFTAPEALGRTVAIVHDRLLTDLRLSDDRSRGRLVELIEALSTGYARGLYDRTLDEQEELRMVSMVARFQAERALRASEARVRHAVLHDPLTGLPNRTLFTDQLCRVLAEALPSARIGVCFIGLDGFKAVNDSLGHPVGDRLLSVVADRLNRHIEPEHLVARLGGDEFAILIEGTTCADDAVKVADKALAVIRDPIRVDPHRLMVSASAGIVERPAGGTDATDVMRAADMTLHWAKTDGKSRWALFEPARNAEEVARYELSAAMPAALSNAEFTLEYQPLVDLVDGRLDGVEALARWRHPTRGTLGADAFVGLAEDTGLIVQLGIGLLEQACWQAIAWRDLTSDPPFVSVNLAGRQISHAGLVADVAAVLDRTGLPPEHLQLEITESAVTGTDDETIDTLHGLANLGVHIAIDDFGTGYSNLAYLCDLPVHGLKLASKFLRGIRRRAAADGTGDALLANVVSLGHTLGLTVTAEGIETEEQAHRLRAIGCDAGQGYYFGRPVPPEEITARLAG